MESLEKLHDLVVKFPDLFDMMTDVSTRFDSDDHYRELIDRVNEDLDLGDFRKYIG